MMANTIIISEGLLFTLILLSMLQSILIVSNAVLARRLHHIRAEIDKLRDERVGKA